MPYAAYDDLSIYAVHDTAAGALAKAKSDAGDPDATFQVAPISDDLATWISRNGWNGNRRRFEVRDGYIVDTTDA
jgi:hypothetical protein